MVDIDEEKRSELEAKFKKTQKIAMKEIQEQVKIARKAISKAEKYGVPFYSSVTPLGQSYKPNSLYEKWGNLDNLEELVDDYIPENEGWEHSAVC